MAGCYASRATKTTRTKPDRPSAPKTQPAILSPTGFTVDKMPTISSSDRACAPRSAQRCPHHQAAATDPTGSAVCSKIVPCAALTLPPAAPQAQPTSPWATAAIRVCEDGYSGTPPARSSAVLPDRALRAVRPELEIKQSIGLRIVATPELLPTSMSHRSSSR